MNLAAELIDLVLASSCICCGQPGPGWCSGCQPSSVAERVPVAQAPPTFAAGTYADELRTALLHYKERGHRRLAPQLAGYLSDAVDAAERAWAEDGPPVLVPVPSRRSAARARGGDHVLRLARLVGRHAGIPVRTMLRLSRPVADSAGLNPVQRRANLAGRMIAQPAPGLGPRAPGGPAPDRLILLDDIVTTGATLTEAARALRVAGWQPRAAAVVAATRLRHLPASGPGQEFAEETLGDFNWAEGGRGSSVEGTNRR